MNDTDEILIEQKVSHNGDYDFCTDCGFTIHLYPGAKFCTECKKNVCSNCVAGHVTYFHDGDESLF